MSVTFHTSQGDLKIEVFCESVPRASENFLALCASDFYNECYWHRNLKGFIVQTGDPNNNGGQSIWGKPFEDEVKPTLKHNARGIVSMANCGPNTNTSQFFITYDKAPQLDGKYTVFGKIIHGFDTLDRIEQETENVITKSVTIHANPIAKIN